MHQKNHGLARLASEADLRNFRAKAIPCSAWSAFEQPAGIQLIGNEKKDK